MTTQPRPLGSRFVPALAAFFTCLAIGLALSALLGVTKAIAVPVGIVISTAVAAYAAFCAGSNVRNTANRP